MNGNVKKTDMGSLLWRRLKFDLISQSYTKTAAIGILFLCNCFGEQKINALYFGVAIAHFMNFRENNEIYRFSPIEKKEYWRLCFLSDFVEKYLIILFVLFPSLVRAICSRDIGEFFIKLAVFPCKFFGYDCLEGMSYSRNHKLKKRTFFAANYIGILLFIGLAAIADDGFDRYWYPALIIMITGLFQYIKYRCFCDLSVAELEDLSIDSKKDCNDSKGETEWK